MELVKLDLKINKSLNKRILYVLKKLKNLLVFYAEKKKLDTRFPLDSIAAVKVKTVRETNLLMILGEWVNRKSDSWIS